MRGSPYSICVKAVLTRPSSTLRRLASAVATCTTARPAASARPSSMSSWFQARLDSWLAQRANDFAVSGLRECLQRLRAHEAKAPELQNIAGHDGIVRRLANSDKVAVAQHHVELLHLAAHVCQKLLGGV